MAHNKIISNLNDLKRVAKNVGKANGVSSKAIDKMLLDDTTGSLVLDYLVNRSKKKGIGVVADKISKAQLKLVDLDMKAGAKAHNLFSKGLENKAEFNKFDKMRSKISNSFKKDYKFNVSNFDGKNPGITANIEAGSITEPINKVKSKVVPFVGSVAITNALYSSGNKNNQEGGEYKVASNKTNSLVEKIAGCVPENSDEKKEREDKKPKENKDELLKKAQEMLSLAYNHINQLEGYCEKLAIENQSLHLDLVQRDRYSEAIKIAEDMYSKGLIKKADIEEKASNISAMDEESLCLFKKAMEDVTIPQSEGISDLTFIIDKDNIKSKESMIDVFSKN